jgi:hypothetical protein
VLPSADGAANTAEVKRTLERKLSARDNVAELQSRGIYRPEGTLLLRCILVTIWLSICCIMEQ